jgi:hypothetical protein
MAGEGEGQDGADKGAGEGGGDKGSAVNAVALDDLKAAGLPETFIGKDGALATKDLVAAVNEGLTLKQQAAERTKLIPADGKYDFAIPKNWERPEGLNDKFVQSWKVSEAKVAAFTPLAKELGLSQAQVSKVVAGWATADAAEKKATVDAANEVFTTEMKKLGDGDAATKRLEAVSNWASANLTKDQAAALLMSATSADAVMAIEALIQKATGSKMSGKGTQGEQPENGELKQQVGKPGFGRAALAEANAKK